MISFSSTVNPIIPFICVRLVFKWTVASMGRSIPISMSCPSPSKAKRLEFTSFRRFTNLSLHFTGKITWGMARVVEMAGKSSSGTEKMSWRDFAKLFVWKLCQGMFVVIKRFAAIVWCKSHHLRSGRPKPGCSSTSQESSVEPSKNKHFCLAPRVNREHVLVPLGLRPERSYGNGNFKSESVRDERLMAFL